MKKLGGRIGLALSLASVGCTSLMSHQPLSKTVTMQVSADVAYQRAAQALTRMGGEITQADAQARVLSAKVHQAVLLNVHVQPVPQGAQIEVIGSLLPNKVVLGTFSEVDDYLALLR